MLLDLEEEVLDLDMFWRLMVLDVGQLGA